MRGRRLLLTLAALAAGLLGGGVAWAVAQAPSAAPAYDLRGHWETGYEDSPAARGPANGTYDITTMDLSTGAFTGTALVEGQSFDIAGQEDGTTVRQTLTESGYVAYDTETLQVQADGRLTADGTFNSSGYDQPGSGYWATQDGPAKPIGTTTSTTPTTPTTTTSTATTSTSTTTTTTGPQKRASATSPVCDYVEAQRTFRCVAQVADASGQQPALRPTGSVHWTASTGGFTSGDTCTLQPPSAGAVATCQVTYGPPAGGIPTGTPAPVTATYSGDATFSGSSGADEALSTPPDPGFTPPTTDTAPQLTLPTPPAEPAPAIGSIDDCPANTMQVDDVDAPTVPATPRAAAQPRQVPATPTVPNPYCDYKAKYTPAEKAAALKWQDYYGLAAASYSRYAARWGIVAGVAVTNPDPTLTKVGAAAAGTMIYFNSSASADASERAVQMGIVNRDPADPAWRTVASPPQIHLSRIPTAPHGLEARQLRALVALERTAARQAANSLCVSTAINRASTALAAGDLAVAAAQDAAGARCARSNADLAAATPAHLRMLTPALVMYTRRLSTSAAYRGAVRRAASTATRRRIAAQVVKRLARVVSLPEADLAKLQTELAAAPAGQLSVASTRAELKQAALSARSWELLERQTQQVLAAAAGASRAHG